MIGAKGFKIESCCKNCSAKNLQISEIIYLIYPLQAHSYALGIFPKLSLLKSVSVAAAAKTGTGSDVITFFQVSIL